MRDTTGLPRLARRAATADDAPFLLALRRTTMDPHLSASGVTTSEEHHRARLDYRFDCAEVLLHEGVPAGLLKVARDDSPWTVIQIQLVPELQGRGLGGEILAEVIADAKAANAGVCLSVLKANPARGLYERMGFVVVGEDGQEYEMLRRA